MLLQMGMVELLNTYYPFRRGSGNYLIDINSADYDGNTVHQKVLCGRRRDLADYLIKKSLCKNKNDTDP